MIILKSEKEMNNQGKYGDVSSYIYCVGEYLGQTKTQLKFKELFYYVEETEEDDVLPNENGIVEKIISINEIPLKNGESEEKFMPLRMKDFGDNPTDEENEYNQNTVEFLFQAYGADINKQTGYADGVEVNFEHIFHQVQNNKKYYKVQAWDKEL